MSHDAPTMSARFIYGSTKIHDGSATIHHGGAMNYRDASKIRYGASTVQAGSATTSSSCYILDESARIGVDRGVSDTPIHPECPHLATITPTVPLRMSPMPLW